MQDYVKIGTDIYYLKEHYFNHKDFSWDDRETGTLIFEKTYSELKSIFVDDVVWSLVEYDEDDQPIETDKSAYCLSGPITDRRNGTCSIVMGKPTELERMIEIIYGGVN